MSHRPLDYCRLVNHAEEIVDLHRRLAETLADARVLEDIAVEERQLRIAFQEMAHVAVELLRDAQLENLRQYQGGPQ